MDIVEYVSKSVNMYFGKVNEGYKYIDKNVSLWDAVIVYYFVMLISMVLSSITDVNTYAEFGSRTGLLILGMFFGSLIVLPIMIFVVYGLIHLFLKLFGGQAKFSDTIKFALSASIFSGFLGTITSVLTNLLMNNMNDNITLSVVYSIVLMFVSIAIAIWGLVIIVNLLSKVHKVSALKAFASVILPVVIFLFIAFLLAMVVIILFGLTSGM